MFFGGEGFGCGFLFFLGFFLFSFLLLFEGFRFVEEEVVLGLDGFRVLLYLIGIDGLRFDMGEFEVVLNFFTMHGIGVVATGLFFDIEVDIDVDVVVRSGDGRVTGSNAWTLVGLLFLPWAHCFCIVIH